MKAVNLHLISRMRDTAAVSMLLRSLAGDPAMEDVSPHEAASLWTLADRIAACFGRGQSDRATAGFGNGQADTAARFGNGRADTTIACFGNGASRECEDWIALMDGFYFSYVIRHIGKEFDLLKVSSDGRCVLNIELKSEDVGEERIGKQLEQNRYYLSHIARAIYSFTYVMETDRLYQLNEKGFLRECTFGELTDVMRKEALQSYLPDGLDQCFRAADYLISPIASPEKFLQGKYFLTNQQFDFRRRILELLTGRREPEEPEIKPETKQETRSEKRPERELPVITISGITGTGKTLLLLDLAMNLSEKRRVLFVHSGPLRRGHLTIDQRLKNVDICSWEKQVTGRLCEYDFLLVDEADHLEETAIEELLSGAKKNRVPVILTFDPHQLLEEEENEEPDFAGSETIALIRQAATMPLSFSGNIRINRPVYAFLRTLLNRKNHPGKADFGCIDVLYANDGEEQEQIARHYERQGYERLPAASGAGQEGEIIAREYDKVLMILDDAYAYDEAQHLCVRPGREGDLRLLYEGLSRTRNRLCLLVRGNEKLFLDILKIRTGETL